MSLFSKYRAIGYKFKEPERITPSEARERRLTGLLERDARFNEVRNFETKLKEMQASRSRVTKEILSNDRITSGQKAASIAAALKQFKERDFSDPLHRQNYSVLRQAQIDLQNAIRRRGGQRKVNQTGFDQRSFNPAGGFDNRTVTGTAARIASRVATAFFPMPSFRHPTLALPCIARHAQREVMFARGYAGKGYKTKKHRTSSSGVPC